MSRPVITVSDEQLRAELRDLPYAISFDVIKQCPSLYICLRNMVEIRQRRSSLVVPQINDVRTSFVPQRFESKRQGKGAYVDRKRAAAGDVDD